MTAMTNIRRSSEADLLELNGVSVTFQSFTGQLVPALDDVNLSIRRGEFVCVVGPSGCGKTTLLRVVGGLVRATTGTVAYADCGHSTTPRDRGIAYVFQDPVLLPWRNVCRNVSLVAEIAKDQSVARRGMQWLTRLGLSDFVEAYPSELSGGMRSRVALARALSLSPRLLLMDEPFAALDETTRYVLGQELQELWVTEGFTAVFVTHSIREAVMLADRVVVLSGRPGRVEAIVRVDAQRPRREELFVTSQIAEIVARIRAQIGPSILGPGAVVSRRP